MSTQAQRRQAFIRYYKESTGNPVANMKEVAQFAKKMGWPMPKPIDPIDLLARQFAEAAREEIRTDDVTKRDYRANLAFNQRQKDGAQATLWVDVDEAPRHHMVKGLTLYREQMVGEAVIATNTAEHWNRVHPDQLPLEFITDLTDDVRWRQNAPPEAGEVAS